ncbi:hypothetical protein [Singulisphaera acidiphila]|uniref:Uncharacterized protein n=1 Tax=Singulisphaera acidiphila (strain ATCC BAA-1392 / DSM 18658 / VKM B-2454 / MOB10) TaxID=886293 RepID=L0DQH5_SINAD|nr:hypothetical protein [Singulisphaera acidiphila]AGA31699.1 hypothetical protein Sinac_7670 [Singulisphaera acidiphila DSM 18658]
MGQVATTDKPKLDGRFAAYAAGRITAYSLMRGDVMDNDSQEAISPKKPKRAAAKPADRKPGRTDGRTKATLLLPDSVDFRLTTLAKSLKLDRSTFAAQLLDAGLRRYALDAALRLHSGDTAPEPDRAGE